MQVKDPAPPPPISAPAGPGKHRAVLGQLSDMDLRLLQVFKSVAECGGMAAAELELNIGTSTVSRHMKDLETRQGKPRAPAPAQRQAQTRAGAGARGLP